MAAPLISMLTPTLDRPGTHQSLYEGFAADLWPRKELVVLDESKRPSPFFSRLKDPRVRYHHEPGKPRIDGVTRIGAARNRLTQLARGAYFENRDDDDVYSPEFSGFMLDRLGDADAAKLVVYKLLHEATGLLFRWDSTKVSGKHWAILGDQIRRVEVKPGEMPADFVDRMKKWFGFTLFGPRRSFERFPFPEEGTEDIRFLEDIESAGGRIVYIEDAADIVIHAIGSGLSSHAYPDRLLGAAGAHSLRAEVGAGMMATMQGMTDVPQGQPIQIVPGVKLAVLSAIAKRYSIRNIATRAKDAGLVIESMRDDVSPEEFGVEAPGDDLRLVLTIGHGTVGGKTLPWKPWGFLSALEKSHIVKAWTSQAVGAGRPLSGGDPAMALVTGAGHRATTLGHRGVEFDVVDGVSEGTKAIGAADVVERYDPKRYAGKVPPHVCSIASSTAIAQQIPGAPYVFERAVPNGGDFGWKVTSTGSSVERVFPVTTPMGKKNIPVQMVHIEGQPNRVILTCPYTGQHFAFQQKSTMGAGRPLGAGAPSLGQLGLNAAGNGSLSFASDYVNSQVDPSGTASSAGAGAIATAGGWSNMTEQQQTQYGEGVVTAIAGVALPGAGAVVAQLIFSAVGTAGSGPGCTCPNCPQPFSPLPPLSSATPGNSGSFQSMCNTTGLREWATDAMCSGYKLAGWNSPASSFAAWIGMVATNAVAWNSATATDGPGIYDVDGVTGLSGAPMQNGALQTPGPTVPPGKLLIVRTVQATSPDPAMAGYSGASFGDVIGVALDYMASVANGNDGSFTWTSNGSVPPNTQVSFMVNNGKTLSPAQIEKGGGPVYSPGLGFKGSPGLKVVGASVAVVALAAGGYSLWALLAGQAQSEAWSRLFKGIAGESQKSGQLLLSAGPKALGGAGETKRKKKRKSTNVQTLLFPRSQFSPSKARAWAARHGYSSGYVDTPPTGDYHRIRQQTPLRNGTLRTISLGGSGVKAVVQRAT